jgi:hypothetical protein
VEDEALYGLIRYWKLRALYYEALYRLAGGSLDPFERLFGSGERGIEIRPDRVSEGSGSGSGDDRVFDMPGS